MQSISSVAGNSGLVNISTAAAMLGCNQATIRGWANQGKLNGALVVLPSGHRRFSRDGLAELINGEKTVNEKKVVRYCRVSSNGQGRGFDTTKGESRNGEESGLSRQCERTKDYCLEHLGVEGELISDIGSGVNFTRKGFLRLISMPINKEVDTVVCSYPDRLARVGLELIQHIVQEVGAKLIIIDTVCESSESDRQSELVELMTSFCTSFCNRLSGLKARKALIVSLPPDLLREAYTLYKSGLSYKAIADRFKHLKDEKDRPYSKNVIRRGLLDHWSACEAALEDEPANSFEVFSTKFVKRAGLKAGVTRKVIIEKYHEFCEKTPGCVELSNKRVGDFLNRQEWVVKGKGWTVEGCVVYRGMTLGGLT